MISHKRRPTAKEDHLRCHAVVSRLPKKIIYGATLWCRARFAVPIAIRRGCRDLPHRPLRQSHPAGQAAVGADPGRPQPRPAVTTRHGAARADRDRPAQRRHPHRLRPLLLPDPGTAVTARRAGRARHRPRQDLLRGDLHPSEGLARARKRPWPPPGRSRPTPRTAACSSPSMR
jgi:hypothetical protein